MSSLASTVQGLSAVETVESANRAGLSRTERVSCTAKGIGALLLPCGCLAAATYVSGLVPHILLYLADTAHKLH